MHRTKRLAMQRLVRALQLQPQQGLEQTSQLVRQDCIHTERFKEIHLAVQQC